MAWRQLELQLEFEVEPVIRAVQGKRYRLQHQPPGSQSVCDGCAFTANTCMRDIPHDDCSSGDMTLVWVEIKQ